MKNNYRVILNPFRQHNAQRSGCLRSGKREMYWRSLSLLDTGAITLFELPFRKHHVRRCLLCSNGIRKTWFLRQYKEGETPDRKAKFRSDSSRNENETPCVQLLCIANFALRSGLSAVLVFCVASARNKSRLKN